MFIAKKVATLMLMPLSICAVLIAIGVLLMWRRKDKTGKLLVTATGLLLFALSYDPVADRIIAPLENRHPPLIDLNHIQWVVVLGGARTPIRGCLRVPGFPRARNIKPTALNCLNLKWFRSSLPTR
jgi:hypothetical protein